MPLSNFLRNDKGLMYKKVLLFCLVLKNKIFTKLLLAALCVFENEMTLPPSLILLRQSQRFEILICKEEES